MPLGGKPGGKIAKYTTVITAVTIPPITMKGFRTRNRSEITPMRITARTLIDFIKQRVAAYKYPRTVAFRDSLPKGATGKILKKELRPSRIRRDHPGG